MRSVIRNTSESIRSCYSCAVALEGAFTACRFCRKRYHPDCSESLEGCAMETCEGRDSSEAFDLVDRSPEVVVLEPGKPWWVRHKQSVVSLGLALGVTGAQGLNSLFPVHPLVLLTWFAVLVVGALAFTLLSPPADD